MSSLTLFVRNSYRQRMQRWFARHNPTTTQNIKLHQRRLYILPTRFGYLYLCLMILLFLSAVNYENSMGFVLTFTLVALGIISLWQTHKNLLGIEVKLRPPAPVFCGESVNFRFELNNPNRQQRYAVGIQYARCPPTYVTMAAESSTNLSVKIPSKFRGKYQASHFYIFTRYPTGLFHAWGWIKFETPVLIFPHPDYSAKLQQTYDSDDDGKITTNTIEGDDFAGLREHRKGESLRHISWKAYAQGRGLLTKTFQGHVKPSLWIDWEKMSESHLEGKLSQMTALVILAENENRAYGLKLPEQMIQQGNGPAHRLSCLSTMAGYAQKQTDLEFEPDAE